MKWMLGFCSVALVAAVCLLGFGGCASTGSSTAKLTPTQALAKIQTIVVQGCQVVQPTLQRVALLDPTVGAVATANGLFCATAGAITVTSLNTLLTTGLPAITAAINQSTLIPANQKLLFVAALGVFGLTVQNALAVFGPDLDDTPASGVAPASTPATPASGAST